MDRSRAGLTISSWILIASAGCAGNANDPGGPLPVAAETAVDINVDAFPDILWHNGTSGMSQVWSMNGSTRNTFVTFDSVLDITDSSGWVPVGIVQADNQSEGRNSVLWHDGGSGALQEWTMNSDGTRQSFVNMDSSLNLPDSSGWRLVATGTFKHVGLPAYLDLVLALRISTHL